MHKHENTAALKNEGEEILQIMHSLFNDSLFLTK